MSIRSYTTGFLFSLSLTVAAPALLWWHEANGHLYPTHEMLGAAFIALAVSQLIVQLIFFLHLGRESKPKWNVVAFALTVFVVFAIVGGTLWIMHNLAYGHAHMQPDVFTEENIFPSSQ